jgi:hypothetical protein
MSGSQFRRRHANRKLEPYERSQFGLAAVVSNGCAGG